MSCNPSIFPNSPARPESSCSQLTGRLYLVIYTAATALIPARLYAYIRGDITQSALAEGWTRSLHVLSSLSVLGPSAKRCLAALHLLNDVISIEENSTTADNLDTSDNADDLPSKPSVQPSSPRRDAVSTMPPIPPLPALTDLLATGGDVFGPGQGPPDFTWLDSLPVGLVAGDYAELLDFSEV